MKGFTLIEAMIAVTIVTLSVAGPLFSASRALVSAEIARDKLTASYLAQEGIEYVRAMRDDAYLHAYQSGSTDVSNVAWLDFTTGSNTWSITGCRSNTCTLDPARTMGTGSGFSLQPCSGASCTPLYLTNCSYGVDGMSCTPPNIYTQQNFLGSVQTLFTRTIRVYDTASTTDKRIVSTVNWNFKAQPYTITVTDHLTPWQ